MSNTLNSLILGNYNANIITQSNVFAIYLLNIISELHPQCAEQKMSPIHKKIYHDITI